MFASISFFQKLVKEWEGSIKVGGRWWKILQKIISGGTIIRYSRVPHPIQTPDVFITHQVNIQFNIFDIYNFEHVLRSCHVVVANFVSLPHFVMSK